MITRLTNDIDSVSTQVLHLWRFFVRMISLLDFDELFERNDTKATQLKSKRELK